MGHSSSLDLNPSTANIALTSQGSEWLWTCFSLFTLAALTIALVGHNRPPGARAHHHLALVILLITAVSYWTLASNLGWTPIRVEYIRPGTRGAQQLVNGASNPPTRAIGYARYIDWTLTWPLMLLMLLLLTGFSLARCFLTMFIASFAVVCWLIGALISTRYKWGMFVFGCAALLYLWWTLVWSARFSAFRMGNDIGSAFIRPAFFLLTCWTVYPIIWACSEGGNVITVTSESIAYGVLDLLTKLVFPAVVLYHVEGLEHIERLGLTSGKYSDSAYPDQANVGHHQHDPTNPNALNAASNTGAPQMQGGGLSTSPSTRKTRESPPSVTEGGGAPPSPGKPDAVEGGGNGFQGRVAAPTACGDGGEERE